jgi:hypothetical protein
VRLLRLVLSLYLVREVKVALIELMYPDITILTSTCISLALRVDCDGLEKGVSKHPMSNQEYSSVEAMFHKLRILKYSYSSRDI